LVTKDLIWHERVDGGHSLDATVGDAVRVPEPCQYCFTFGR
jgi:hypothetical protein